MYSFVSGCTIIVRRWGGFLNYSPQYSIILSPSVAESEPPEPYHFDPIRYGIVSLPYIPVPVLLEKLRYFYCRYVVKKRNAGVGQSDHTQTTQFVPLEVGLNVGCDNPTHSLLRPAG
jgi:hypothetical protein